MAAREEQGATDTPTWEWTGIVAGVPPYLTITFPDGSEAHLHTVGYGVIHYEPPPSSGNA